MKILLLRPVSPIITFSIPVGLLYISAYLKKELGVDVEVLDARLEQLGDAELCRRIKSIGPDVVGISSMSVEARHAHRAAALVKQTLPDAKVILGGPYPSASGTKVLNDANIDFAVKGEGELAVAGLVKAIMNGERVADDIPGIIRRTQDGTTVNVGTGHIIDLDKLPFPDWGAVDVERYFADWRNGQNKIRYSKRGMPVFTSRGCPYACIFCHGLFGKAFRARSPESVIGEIKVLKQRYGIKEVEFNDDIFNLDLERAKGIARLILGEKLDLKFTFPNGLRADLMDRELVDLLVEMGTYRIMYAIESASERMQKVLKKEIDLDKTRDMINYTTKKGIITGAFIILGLPGETEEEMEESISFVCSLDITVMNTTYLTPFPGTEVGEKYLETEMDPNSETFYDYTVPRFNFSNVTDSVLKTKRREAYRRFYMNPARIAQILRRVPKNYQLLRNIWTTSKLFFSDSVMY